MTKYSFDGANINAKNLHIGDIYNYSSPEEYVKKNSDLNFSDTEMELVKIIFANTGSDEERKSILQSLRSIKTEDSTIEEKKKSILSFKPLLNTLKKIGEKTAIGIIAKVLIDFANQHHLSDYVTQILK